MRDIANIVILTGAGISAESGLATFRGPEGLWEGHRVEDVATPEAFARDPVLVQRFYDARRANLAAVEPNAAHEAPATGQLAMHVDQPLRARALVQIVDVLGNQQQLARPRRVEPG